MAFNCAVHFPFFEVKYAINTFGANVQNIRTLKFHIDLLFSHHFVTPSIPCQVIVLESYSNSQKMRPVFQIAMKKIGKFWTSSFLWVMS